MSGDSLVSPQATARFVVTIPPEPSRFSTALKKDIAAAYTAFTSTDDAFRHLALRAKARLVILIPYVDRIGAEWATELFQITDATERVLVLREVRQLDDCGGPGVALKNVATRILDYSAAAGDGSTETFHAKIVLADGVAAYVGSANLLRRSKHINLECGMLVEGPAVQSIKVVVDAVLETFITGN
jgi:phosphatidylserine/phosphatidylglycerophosphate/cardiolipin synthase-like enzyme